jgi:hypothetical protein
MLGYNEKVCQHFTSLKILKVFTSNLAWYFLLFIESKLGNYQSNIKLELFNLN